MVILLGLVALTLSGAAENATTLTVVGEGSALASADVVYVSISATTVGENLTQASANSSETLNRTIDALIDAGVNSDDIQAGRGRSVSNIQTYSRVCNNSTCVMVAEEGVTLVNEQVTIRFAANDEDLINRTFEVAEAEGTEAAISGYSLEDKTAAFAEARQRAIQNAEDDAEDLATAAGLELGKRLEIIERSGPKVRQPHSYHDPMGISMMDFFDFSWPGTLDPYETSINAEPGVFEVISQVVVTYEVTS
ncbi:MAG: SIMPL domain-containing protein [Methanomassiliicoccales archaeon]|nr:SIMPL domain-containing protein [Methanomassiliicoccales archaeon]